MATLRENQHLESLDKAGAILNPLHTTVFATRLAAGVPFDEIVSRFGEINAKLGRDQMVKMLCILGHGTAWYSVSSGSPYNATYMRDREQPLIMQINHREPNNAFYRFYVELMGHLTRSVLGLTNMTHQYGEPPPPRDVRTYEAAEFNEG